jgi:hypothetical protein
MSTGAKAGIAESVIIYLALIAGSAFFLPQRRKQIQQLDVPMMPETSGQSTELKQMYGGTWRAEMDGVSGLTEIDSKDVFVITRSTIELEAPRYMRRRDPGTQ